MKLVYFGIFHVRSDDRDLVLHAQRSGLKVSVVHGQLLYERGVGGLALLQLAGQRLFVQSEALQGVL